MNTQLSIRSFLAKKLDCCTPEEMEKRGPCVSFQNGNHHEYVNFDPFEDSQQKDVVEQYAMRHLESIRIQKNRVIAVSTKGMPSVVGHNNTLNSRNAAFITAIAKALGWKDE